MDFQSEKKSFGKLRIKTFQPNHQMLCMLEVLKESKQCKRHNTDTLYAMHVEGVERKQNHIH